MVDKDSKKGHNTLLCTVGAFAIYKPALAFNTHNDIMYLYLCNYHYFVILFGGGGGGEHVFLGRKHTLVSPQIKPWLRIGHPCKCTCTS